MKIEQKIEIEKRRNFYCWVIRTKNSGSRSGNASRLNGMDGWMTGLQANTFKQLRFCTEKDRINGNMTQHNNFTSQGVRTPPPQLCN